MRRRQSRTDSGDREPGERTRLACRFRRLAENNQTKHPKVRDGGGAIGPSRTGIAREARALPEFLASPGGAIVTTAR